MAPSAGGGEPLAELAERIDPVAPDTPVNDAQARFAENPGLPGLPVADERGEVFGLLDRVRFTGLLSSRYGYALFNRRPVRELMYRGFLAVGTECSLIQAYEHAAGRAEERRGDCLVILRAGRYCGLVAVPRLMAAVAEAQKEMIARLDELQGAEARQRGEEEQRRRLLEQGIQSLRGAVERYAGGDLSTRPHGLGAGPLVAVDLAVERMRVDLAGLISAVQSPGAAAAGHLEGARAVADRVNESGGRQEHDAAGLLEHIIRLRESSLGDARTAREAATSSLLGKEAALTGGARVAESINLLHDLVGELGAHGRRLGALESRMESILAVTGMIEELADRSHTLSINAAILAAQSRSEPFTVIAGEMRQLAQLTAQRNRDIGSLLGEVRDETRSVVGGMQRLVAMAASGESLAGEARGGLNEVIVALSEAVHDLGEIAGRLDARAATLEEERRSADALLVQARENRGGARRLLRLIGELSDGMSKLRQAASRFKLTAG